MNELRLDAPHTHLYPGLRGALSGSLPAAGAEAPCQIVFSDGSMALGSLTVRDGTEAVLETGPYTTAAGTAIPAKRWGLALSFGDQGVVRFVVRVKLRPPD